MSNRFLESQNGTIDYLDDDIDDETFLSAARNARINESNALSASERERQSQQLQAIRAQIEERALRSTERSIGMLMDSERTGIQSAEELAKQREQLERTDRRLDQMVQTLSYSQKQINGIKSIFSSMKNYFGSKKNEPVLAQQQQPEKQDLTTAKGEDIESARKHLGLLPKNDSVRTNRPIAAKSTNEFDQRLNSNLEEMNSAVTRLKGLAHGLTVELNDQNRLIDKVIKKTDIVDVTVQSQNTQIQKLIRKG